MTEQELQQLRREKWGQDDKSIRTLQEARAFVERVGFCLMFPQRNLAPMPSFIGAFVGAETGLPDWQHAFEDPRASDATDLMVRLLRERLAFEANYLDANNPFLLAASVFPYFYALAGERNPKQAPQPGPRSPYSQLSCDVYAVIHRDGPVSKQKLLEKIGGGLSTAVLDTALAELWSKLRITRVDYRADAGSVWDVLQRWAPDAVHEGIQLSVPEALSALLSKYLDNVIAIEQTELEALFGQFAPRSKVRDAVNALLSARELSFTPLGGRSLLQIAPAKEPLPVVAPRQPVP